MTELVSVDLAPLLPVLAPPLGAAAVLLLDVLAPARRRTHLVLAVLALLGGATATLPGLGRPRGEPLSTFCLADGGACLYAVGPVAAALQLAALVTAVVVLVLAWPSWSVAVRGRSAVVVALLLASTAGAVAVAAAQDLGSWLVALELATLPTVALVALRGSQGGRRSTDGALALLTTSLVSFALLALAAGCWYAATGSGLLNADAAQAAVADAGTASVLALAVVLFVAGVGFKLSLVPFHAWTPQAYVGAPVPVALFLAATSKVAALAALLAVLGALVPLDAPALVAIALVAAVTMSLGNVLALRQHDLIRLLAWSTVAQAGWVVLPLAALPAQAVTAAAGYLVIYLLATVVAFAVLIGLAHATGERTAYTLAGQRGLLRTHPVVGTALGLALLSLAGLPPAIIGLVAKVVALQPVVAAELWWLAVVAAVNAVLGIAVYLRWLKVVIEPPTEAADPAAHPSGATGPAARPQRRPRRWRGWHPAHVAVVLLGLLALVATSVWPQLLLGVVA